jgi:hypothetical protein
MSSEQNRRNRDAGSGQYVTEEFAKENPSTTVSEKTDSSKLAEAFLKRLSKEGGAIVSSNDVTTDGITFARAEGRFYADENNFGYVWIPIKRTWR